MTYQELVSYLSEKGVSVSQQQCEALSRYAALLKEWNERMNLTSIVEEPEVIEKHFLDSALACVGYSFAGRKVIDIGSGAGFPGAVIALLFPTSSVTLLDATKKKFDFLQTVKDEVIAFIAIRGGKKIYIPSAYAMENEAKITSENKPLSLTGDSFPKIIVRHDIRKRWYDENGVLNIGVIDFLLDDTVI